MELPREIEDELRGAREAEVEGNQGKSRVCARRAVGKAFVLSKLFPRTSPYISATQCLREISNSANLPSEMRAAATRLAASVAYDGGKSVSTTPIEDALLVIAKLLGTDDTIRR